MTAELLNTRFKPTTYKTRYVCIYFASSIWAFLTFNVRFNNFDIFQLWFVVGAFLLPIDLQKFSLRLSKRAEFTTYYRIFF